MFLYFAKFPRQDGVKAMATMGASDMPEYRQLLDALDALTEHSLVPQIDHYVYGQTIDDLKQRIDRLQGTWLYADYGELTATDDSRGRMAVEQRVAVTVAVKLRANADMLERLIASDRSLSLLTEVYARMKADARSGSVEWLSTDGLARAELVPFVASELYSYGWTLLVSPQAPDALGVNGRSRQLARSML